MLAFCCRRWRDRRYQGVTILIDVLERLKQLQQHHSALCLYALVDGVQYETHRQTRMTQDGTRYPLFTGTPDAALAHAGPWLVDVAGAAPSFLEDVAALEQETPSVTWLFAVQDLGGLAQLLQLHLETRLPDGRAALLRFWDPRVLVKLAQILEPAQREAMFGHIHEWHLLLDGKRAIIGRRDADV